MSSWFPRKSASPRRPIENRTTAAEIFEAREMLAGNVSATLVDGVLTLSGDSRRNDLTVQIDSAGSVAFSSSNTTVNGQPAANVQFAGPITDIAGSFGRGRDRVVIEGVVETTGDNAFVLPVLTGNISIDMGRGRDNLSIRGLQVDGELAANGGRHRDRVTVESVNAGSARVSGDRGRDTLAVRDVDVDGDINVSGGRGRDRMIVGEDVTIGGATNVSGGRGRDRTISLDSTASDSATEADRTVAAAALDQVFDRLTGASASADQQEAWSRSNDLLFTNTIDESVFPTTFPAIDPAEFVETTSGLRHRIVDAGSGAMPAADSTVRVAYQGLLTDGTQFDGTAIVDNGGFDETAAADLVLADLIDGWQEGIPLIGEGGRIQLLIPPALAYGSAGTNGVPGDSTLFFNIELLPTS